MSGHVLSKSDVDRLGERLRVDGDADDLRLLDEYRLSFADAHALVIATTKALGQTEVTSRPAKSTAAIVEKLRRESVRLTQMQDISGCRIVVPYLSKQDLLTTYLTSAFAKVNVFDRREKPSHGYRAVHIVVSVDGHNVEIQIRTSLQQFWAELSEKVADKFGNSIKYGQGDSAILQQLLDLSASIRQAELLRNSHNWDSATMEVLDANDAHIKRMGAHLLVGLGVENDFSD